MNTMKSERTCKNPLCSGPKVTMGGYCSQSCRTTWNRTHKERLRLICEVLERWQVLQGWREAAAVELYRAARGLPVPDNKR